MRYLDRVNFKRESRINIKGNILSLFAANLMVNIFIALGIWARDYVVVSIVIFVVLSVSQFGLALLYVGFIDSDSIDYKRLFISYSGGIKRFLRHALTFIVKYVIILLASTLLLIPGLIKRYSYSQVEYIRATHPDIGVIKCLLMSKRVMRWHKLDLFLLDLSFIVWIILIPLTGGLVLIYFLPYYNTTMARYHLYLKSKYDLNRMMNRNIFNYFIYFLYNI